MAEVCDRITALELNDRCMTRIEQHLSLLSTPDISANNQNSDMLIDPPAVSNPIIMQMSSQSAALTVQKPLNPLLPSFIPSSPIRAPISTSSTVAIPNGSFSSSTPNSVSFPTQTHIETLSLQESLFSSNSSSPFPFKSFNISSFNINGLKTFSQNKIKLLNNFLSLK
ncbi:hypothetical protein RCL_jg18943.t1 [Rhizophagus clarus]|uniref:Uncharacterized protein n=1 Tax=Rhizophagus clarus TaxID=94130 RepID=A0A8H3MB72_9GLOM|nr:hypothetical protein RCL_jg18943.t1 [Rhizophagus clarus]